MRRFEGDAHHHVPAPEADRNDLIFYSPRDN
jgi:hypothetical protein